MKKTILTVSVPILPTWRFGENREYPSPVRYAALCKSSINLVFSGREDNSACNLGISSDTSHGLNTCLVATSSRKLRAHDLVIHEDRCVTNIQSLI